ncbi:unnamed protein product, partial [Brenthis ino]
MFCEDACLGTNCGVEKIRALSDSLNADVVEQLNESQGLVQITGFLKESNEYQYKKCLQDRISDVASWRWVLEDLSKRLADSINALKYEHNALRVVVQRVQGEIDNHSREGTRPGAICPLTDAVENYITEELKFLKEQKKNFERLILELEKQTKRIEKIKNRVEADVTQKSQALHIDETCVNKNYQDAVVEELKKKRGFPVACWIRRCAALKRAGLKALCNAITTRQQIRGARVQLSISAQAYAARVDAALRRRLHTNRIKIQDLKWQREEAVRDFTCLEEELAMAEKTLIETLDQERIAEARFGDRTHRPSQELIKDDVNRKLRDEQSQLRKIQKQLRNNIKRIITLQNNLSEAITQIDCYAEDLAQVISLDEDRIRNRQGEVSKQDSTTDAQVEPHIKNELTVIREEDEDDDYPIDY